MNLFLATNSTKIHVGLMRKLEPPNMLISYHYFKDILMFLDFTEGWLPNRLMIDSGAFSVWTKKGSIDIDAYIQYCKNVKQEVDDYNQKLPTTIPKTDVFFVNLDVLPGNFGVYPTKEQREESAQRGWNNMEYMENNGVKVIHVFHQHEDFEWLRKLMKHQQYIGLSPANDEPQASKNRWLSKCFSIVKTNVKCHGFAVTSCNTLLKFPFYSADSSSWVQGAKYAAIPTFKDGKMHSVKFKDKENLSQLVDRSTTDALSMLESYHPRMEQGIRAYLEMEKFVTEVWAKRGIIWT